MSHLGFKKFLVLFSGALVAFSLVSTQTAVAVPQTTTNASIAFTATSVSIPKKLKAKKISNGRVKLTWTGDERTKKQRIHLGLSHIKKKGKVVIKVPAKARSYVLTAKDFKKIGAPIGSGLDISIRIGATGKSGGERLSGSAYIAAGQPKNRKAKGAMKLKVASFNAAFLESDGRNRWLKQIKPVAKVIAGSGASVVALQESTFNSANGKSPQVTKLLNAVKKEAKKKNSKANWKLVRSTRYTKPSRGLAGDPTRIMYDSKKVKQISKCKQTHKGQSYSNSCTIKLPRIGGKEKQRYAAYAHFQDRKTKKKFWVVSIHLEPTKGKKYDKNRIAQLKTINKKMNSLNKKKEPVLLMGDFNLSIKREEDKKAMNQLLKWDYLDAATAKKATNLNHQTYNGWRKQTPSARGYAGRIDMILAKGRVVYFSHYKNRINGYKASDHNLITSTVYTR